MVRKRLLAGRCHYGRDCSGGGDGRDDRHIWVACSWPLLVLLVLLRVVELLLLWLLEMRYNVAACKIILWHKRAVKVKVGDREAFGPGLRLFKNEMSVIHS